MNGGLAAAHPDRSSSPRNRPSLPNSRLSDSLLNTELAFTHADHPSAYPLLDRDQHAANIAPQHLFHGVTLDGAPSETNGYPHQSPYALKRTASPNLLSAINGNGIDVLSSESTIDLRVLISSNTTLKTRVSELEVINELFRGRVNELESTEAETQRQLDDALRREQELRSKLMELQALLAASSADADDRPVKRARMNGALDPATDEPGKSFEQQVEVSHSNAADTVHEERV